jgi:carboxyl-terminal processing protease
MRNKLQQAGLVLFGLIAGIFVSLNFSAIAQKEAAAPLPIEELRTFADVFGAIKAGYVEPVEDKKLITHAIRHAVRPRPALAYLDADAFKELQVGTQGEFGGLGIEVGMEDGFVKVVSPIEDTPAFRAGIKAGRPDRQARRHADQGHDAERCGQAHARQAQDPDHPDHRAQGRSQADGHASCANVIKVQSVKSKMVEPGYGYVR